VSFNWATRLQEEYWILQVSLLVLQAFGSLYLLGLQKLVGGGKLAVFRGPCIKVAFKVTSTKTSKGKKNDFAVDILGGSSNGGPQNHQNICPCHA